MKVRRRRHRDGPKADDGPETPEVQADLDALAKLIVRVVLEERARKDSTP